MSTEIYYFSGTGNSLHVAEELKKRLPKSTLIPIVRTLKNEPIETQAPTIGIVFPIHAFTLPWVVKQFLQKICVKSASYIFAIATRECFSTVFKEIDSILALQGKTLNAYLSFEMPQTYLPMFQIYSQEKILQVESQMIEKVESFKDIILKKEISRPKDSRVAYPFSHILYPIITSWYQKKRFPSMENLFYSEATCISCGTCEKICLSDRIKLVDKKPIWKNDIKCKFCFACIHFCPVNAIQIRERNTTGKGRYHHPEVSIKDISNQK